MSTVRYRPWANSGNRQIRANTEFVACVTITGHIPTKRGGPKAELYCPRPERHKLWGEFWWKESKYQWLFFDDVETSETYAEQVEHCPA